MGGLNEPPPLCGGPHAEPPSSVLRHEALPRLLKGVLQAFHHQALQQMRAAGIPDLFPGAAPLILHLGDEDGLTMSELAKRCRLESSTLTPLMDELERQGIAARARDPEDRRVVRLYLTPHGRELEPRLRALLWELQEVALQDIAEPEIEVLHRVLAQMAANLEGLECVPGG